MIGLLSGDEKAVVEQVVANQSNASVISTCLFGKHVTRPVLMCLLQKFLREKEIVGKELIALNNLQTQYAYNMQTALSKMFRFGDIQLRKLIIKLCACDNLEEEIEFHEEERDKRWHIVEQMTANYSEVYFPELDVENFMNLVRDGRRVCEEFLKRKSSHELILINLFIADHYNNEKKLKELLNE